MSRGANRNKRRPDDLPGQTPSYPVLSAGTNGPRAGSLDLTARNSTAASRNIKKSKNRNSIIFLPEHDPEK
jgi:hypothetical protein